MSVYEQEHMDRMRQEAMRRSQEMYRRSEGSSNRQEKQAPLPTAAKPYRRDDFSVLKRFLSEKADSDKLLVAALLLILAKDGADKKLLLALGYILL